MKLYELTDAYALLLEEEGYEDALAQLSDAIEEKAENIAAVIRSLEAEEATFEQEAKRLREKAIARGNKVHNLKTYLLQNLQAAGIDKVKGRLFTVSVQPSPPSCTVEDEGLVPQDWKALIPEQWRVDAKRIIAAYKEGVNVPGTIVVEGHHIRIS